MIISKDSQGNVVIDITEENYEKLNNVLDTAQYIVTGLVVVAVIGFTVFQMIKGEK